MYVIIEPLLGVSQVTTCDLEVWRVVTTKVKIEAKMVETPTFCKWVCPRQARSAQTLPRQAYILGPLANQSSDSDHYNNL